MSGPPAVAALALAALLVCGCEVAPQKDEPERPTPPARGTRFEPRPAIVHRSTSASQPSSAADAIARLRQRLGARGFSPDVTAGPMLAIWSEDPPRHRLAGESAVPAAVRSAVAAPTWLVLTDAGAWWVWEHDDLGPVVYAPSSRF